MRLQGTYLHSSRYAAADDDGGVVGGVAAADVDDEYEDDDDGGGGDDDAFANRSAEVEEEEVGGCLQLAHQLRHLLPRQLPEPILLIERSTTVLEYPALPAAAALAQV